MPENAFMVVLPKANFKQDLEGNDEKVLRSLLENNLLGF